MADNFKGLKKEDHARLARAAQMYENLTGERTAGLVSSIPMEEPEKDAAAEAQKAAEALARDADITRKREEADRQARKLQAERARGALQDENPGPGQPAMVSERAKAQGHSRKGEEPPAAAAGRK